MKVIGWVLFGLAVASSVLGILSAAYLLPFKILELTPGGSLRVTNTLLLFAITLYVLKKV